MKDKIRKYWRPVLLTSYCAVLTVMFFKMVLTSGNDKKDYIKINAAQKIDDVKITYPIDGDKQGVDLDKLVKIKQVDEIDEPKDLVEIEPINGYQKTYNYYDIPLDYELQDHLFTRCDMHGVDPSIVVAMMKRESNFNPRAVSSDGSSYGLLQIQPRWHKDRMGYLGCSDLLDPYQNITVAVDYLAELYDSGNSTEWVLMAYNGGTSYANKKVRRGEVSSYARTIINNSKNLKTVTSGDSGCSGEARDA